MNRESPSSSSSKQFQSSSSSTSQSPQMTVKTAAMTPGSILTPNFDPSKITKIPLDLRCVIGSDEKLAFVLTNVLTPQECQGLITLSESTGYSLALVNYGTSKKGQDIALYKPDTRAGQRVMIDDRDFANKLLSRICSFIPVEFQGQKLVEINERLRFLKYAKPGDHFKKHLDGRYKRPDGSATTLITLQVYLNGGHEFQGGATTFLRDTRNKNYRCLQSKGAAVAVTPVAGHVLVFEHKILHEGSVLKAGKKYTIRLDVLYTGNGPKRVRRGGKIPAVFGGGSDKIEKNVEKIKRKNPTMTTVAGGSKKLKK